MELAEVLPHLTGLRVVRREALADELIIEAIADSPEAACPACQQPSRRRHGHYTRLVADQPIGAHRVTIHLRVRRFRCQNPACPRRTFGESMPALVEPHARHSRPLQRALQDIGLTLGGRPGARFAQRRAITVSRMTLLRRVRALPDPAFTSPTVLGVDDFALRRGRRYGSLLVDLERRRPVDVLPGRTAETLASWLREHGQPAIICRDRGGDYASGARQGAPDALQVADRFHLQKNSSEVLERILIRHPAALRAAVTEEPPAAAPTSAAQPVAAVAADPPADPRRARRLARYERVMALRREGWSITAIGAAVGLSRPTVRKYVTADGFPEWPRGRGKLRAGTAQVAYIQQRWAEGCRDGKLIWEELRARGFSGSVRMVQKFIAPWRVEPSRRGRAARKPGLTPAPAPPRPQPPSARQAVWLLVRPLNELEPEQQEMRGRLLAAAPEVEQALAVIVAFRRMVQDRDHPALDGWLRTAEASGARELRRFAASLQRDRAAVQAALTEAWSSGQVEGQVTKLKLIKRQMYGRGKLDLLRKRLLLAG
jgi:transposase